MSRFRKGSLIFLPVVAAVTTGLAATSGASGPAGPMAAPPAAVSGDTPGSGLRDQGVGTYTDPSVANQLSSFTINPLMVSCGVGTIAAGQWSGPFAMLMYATDLEKYKVDSRAGRIQATGRMRSITRVAGGDMEDVEHDFVAIAVDGGPSAKDRFDVHLRSPFWNTANPMCARSSEIEGGCRFGGDVLMGEVEIGE